MSSFNPLSKTALAQPLLGISVNRPSGFLETRQMQRSLPKACYCFAMSICRRLRLVVAVSAVGDFVGRRNLLMQAGQRRHLCPTYVPDVAASTCFRCRCRRSLRSRYTKSRFTALRYPVTTKRQEFGLALCSRTRNPIQCTGSKFAAAAAADSLV